jgi:hypothetical protein
MLKLNVNQEKQLTFEVQIGGVQSDKVTSHLRIVIDEIEYGFPAIVGKESITVNLPPLKAVTARSLKEGEEVQVKLEIIADGNYLTPWSDSFVLSNPLVVEAKIMDSEFKNPPAFKTRLVQEGKSGDRKQGVRIERELVEEGEEEKPQLKNKYISESEEDDLTEKIVNKLAEKLSKGLIEKKKFIKDEPIKDEEEDEVMDKDDQEEEVPPSPIQKESKKTSKKVTKSQLLNMTEADVYAYMDRAGTKNEQIQKIIYEQAEIAAGSSKPYKVLSHVVKLLKDKK